MERSRFTCLVILFLFAKVSFATIPPLEEYRSKLHYAYIEGDMSKWTGWVNEIKEAYDNDFDGQLLVVQAEYGLVGYYLGTGQRKKAKEQVENTDKRLKVLLKKHPEDSRLISFNAAFDAFKIPLAIYKAPFLGPRIERNIEKAISLNPNEPMVWLEHGNSLYNRPKMFGGDKAKAIESYQKSLQLFNKDSTNCNYLRIMVEVFIVKGYYELEDQKLFEKQKRQLEEKYGKLKWLDDFLNSTMMK